MANTLEPGFELDSGKYRILRLIGQGGMGSVYEAEHRDTQKRVAIKCMHPAHASDPDVAMRMVREAQATARVRHPNVVDIYDVCREGTLIYLVMEYLEGEPLAHALARGDLPLHGIIALLLPAIRGVAAAHKQGVIHRDLKPDNIFLAREGDELQPTPKVLDFGISKVELRGTDQRALTRSGAAVGTPSYMSYEQLAAEVSLDGRADVYACGVILYEAMTGQVPYQADTFPELMVRFLHHTPQAPKQLCPEIPSALSRVVMWALARDREDRIPSMEVLARELEPFSTRHGYESERTRSQTGPLSAPSTLAPLSAEITRPLPRKHRGGLAMVVGLALLLIALTLALTLRLTSRPSAALAPEPAPLRPIPEHVAASSAPAQKPPEPAPARVEPSAPAPSLTKPPPAAQRRKPASPVIAKPKQRDLGITETWPRTRP